MIFQEVVWNGILISVGHTMGSTTISMSHIHGKRIVVSAVIVILGETMILRVEVVPNWIGLKTMEIVTNLLIGMIPRMVLMVLDMGVMVQFLQTSMAAPSTLLMDPTWTSKLEEIVTMGMARRMP